MKTFFITIIAIIVLVIAGGLVFMYSGAYNVSAAEPTHGFMKWVLSTISDNSVRTHATAVTAPNLAEYSADEGLEHFHAMCVGCHGAPGVAKSEIGEGLDPQAPDLAESARTLTPAELYWVVDNGIKMTAMPSFGKTHNEEEMWNIVAFLEELPKLTPKEYQQRLQEAGLTGAMAEEGEHEHAEEEMHEPEATPSTPPAEQPTQTPPEPESSSTPPPSN